MKVKYIGAYKGNIPWLGRTVTPGDVIDVPPKVAEKLLAGAQFERVVEKPLPKPTPIVSEPEETGGET